VTEELKKDLVATLCRLSADLAVLGDLLENSTTTEPDRPAMEPAPEPEKEEAVKLPTFEEARAVLAEKSRTGFRAEVKAILTKHGVKQLSEVTDPKVLAEMVSEAEAIGNG
jgi:hypothetical protein